MVTATLDRASTEWARQIRHTDERVKLESAAGRLMRYAEAKAA